VLLFSLQVVELTVNVTWYQLFTELPTTFIAVCTYLAARDKHNKFPHLGPKFKTAISRQRAIQSTNRDALFHRLTHTQGTSMFLYYLFALISRQPAIQTTKCDALLHHLTHAQGTLAFLHEISRQQSTRLSCNTRVCKIQTVQCDFR
jgi:hypothetical protein